VGRQGVNSLVVGLVLWLLAACAPTSQLERKPIALNQDQQRTPGVTQDQAETIAAARAAQNSPELSAGEKKALDMAIEKLEKDLDLSGQKFSRQRVYAVQWPDSSLGCPRKGVSYLQVITPGYLVSLTANGKVYTVHVGAGNAVICDRLTTGLEARRTQSQNVVKVYRAARVNLAERLKIDPSEITVTGMKPSTWEDSSLGCPQIGRKYEQLAVEGFVIRMECRGRHYEYHSDNDGKKFVSCDELESCYETE